MAGHGTLNPRVEVRVLDRVRVSGVTAATVGFYPSGQGSTPWGPTHSLLVHGLEHRSDKAEKVARLHHWLHDTTDAEERHSDPHC
jgi:hypothetical protein